MGAEFRLDPVALLEERDEFRTAVRIAAALHNSNERQKAADKARTRK